jgi:hypothetical protein
MKRFVEGEDRAQSTLFPERLDDYLAEDNPARVIDVFVDELDLMGILTLGHPSTLPGSVRRVRRGESQRSQLHGQRALC